MTYTIKDLLGVMVLTAVLSTAAARAWVLLLVSLAVMLAAHVVLIFCTRQLERRWTPSDYNEYLWWRALVAFFVGVVFAIGALSVMLVQSPG